MSAFICFWNSWQMPNCEIMSILVSINFGEQNFRAMKTKFLQANLLGFLITILSFVFYSNFVSLLTMANFNKDLAINVQKIIIKIVPVLCIQSISENTRNYCFAQKVMQPFTYINIINFIFYIFGSYYFIWYLQLGLYGFIWVKTITEIFNFAAYLYILLKYCDQRTNPYHFTWDMFEMNTFGEYSIKYVTMFVGWYVAYLGVEIPLIFVGTTGDIDFMAAWVVIFNIMNFFWVTSSGLSMVPRTDVGIAIGERNFLKVKKLAYMCIFLSFF